MWPRGRVAARPHCRRCPFCPLPHLPAAACPADPCDVTGSCGCGCGLPTWPDASGTRRQPTNRSTVGVDEYTGSDMADRLWSTSALSSAMSRASVPARARAFSGDDAPDEQALIPLALPRAIEDMLPKE